MKVNYIRSFIKALSDFKKDYSVVCISKSEERRKALQQIASIDFKFPTNLVMGFHTKQDFDLTDSDIEFLKDVIPDRGNRKAWPSGSGFSGPRPNRESL